MRDLPPSERDAILRAVSCVARLPDRCRVAAGGAIVSAAQSSEIEVLDATDAPIVWTRFRDPFTKTAEQITHSWPELVEHLRVAGPYSSKAACPWIKLARFGEVRTEAGALRHDANIVEITGVEADYDGEQIQPEQAVEMLERALLRAVVYTSPSHTPEKPRWRVLAPLSQPYRPDARSALLARINGVLGGVLAGESFTLSQSYYYGRLSSATQHYKVLATFDDPMEGLYVDTLDDLDDGAISRRINGTTTAGATGAGAVRFDDAAEAVERLGRKLRAGDGRRDLLMRYIASRSARGFDGAEVRALVGAFVDTYFDAASPHDDYRIGDIIAWATERDAAKRAEIARVKLPLTHAAGLPASKGGANPSATLPSGGKSKSEVLQEAAEGPEDGAQEAGEGEPIPDYADLASVDSDPPKPRAFVVAGWIPRGTVVGIWGAGGIGKSLLAQQIATAVGNGVPALGSDVIAGSVLGYFAEDDNDELRRRQRSILRSMGRSAAYSTESLHLQGRAGLDNCLLAFDRERLPMRTPFLRLVEAECARIRPALLILDNIAQLYAGIENDRYQVTAFCNVLTGLAQRFDLAVLLLGHPGKAEGSEYSGSTAWDGAVRTRLWLERRSDDMLELYRKKANYANRDSCLLTYQDGAFVETQQADISAVLAAGTEPAVLDALATLTARQVATSHNPTASTYLPRLMRSEGLLGGSTIEQAGHALRRLIDAGRVVVNADLGWKKPDRHPAVGLKVAP
jgi:hypothetical protein